MTFDSSPACIFPFSLLLFATVLNNSILSFAIFICDGKFFYEKQT